jgi:hypothetical protein
MAATLIGGCEQPAPPPAATAPAAPAAKVNAATTAPAAAPTAAAPLSAAKPTPSAAPKAAASASPAATKAASPAPAASAAPIVDAMEQSKATKTMVIDSQSGPDEIALAQQLTKAGAKLYTAYWCPHCHTQGQLFGKEAMNKLNRIECAEDGQNSQIAMCKETAAKASKLTGEGFGFPTWEINGKFYPGTQKLTTLAEIAGYTGSQNFKN